MKELSTPSTSNVPSSASSHKFSYHEEKETKENNFSSSKQPPKETSPNILTSAVKKSPVNNFSLSKYQRTNISAQD